MAKGIFSSISLSIMAAKVYYSFVNSKSLFNIACMKESNKYYGLIAVVGVLSLLSALVFSNICVWTHFGWALSGAYTSLSVFAICFVITKAHD